ncbi:unnamed protein product [Closterium sp. NIES-65]|nr:unnamed protein product [Closterium sp. NIES-65]
MFFRLSTSLRLSAPFRFAAPVAHMLLRAPLIAPQALLLPPRSPSSHAASHGPVARSSQRSLATTATGHSAAASSRRRTAACACCLRVPPAAPCPLYYCSPCAAPCPDAAPSLALLALSSPPRRTDALSGGDRRRGGREGKWRGAGRQCGDARFGSMGGIAQGATGFRRRTPAREPRPEGAVLRGGGGGLGPAGWGAVRVHGAPGATGASGRADGPSEAGGRGARRGWGGVVGGGGGGAVRWCCGILDNVQPERMEPFDARHAPQRTWPPASGRPWTCWPMPTATPLSTSPPGGAVALRKHFVSLHQMEHEKRMQHLNHASPNGALATAPLVPFPLAPSHPCHYHHFCAAARPPLGACEQAEAAAEGGVSGQAAALPAGRARRAAAPPTATGSCPSCAALGVVVRLAADEALKRDLAAAVRSGQVGAVLLVSDDRGYSRALGAAAAAGLHHRRCRHQRVAAAGGAPVVLVGRCALGPPPWRSPGRGGGNGGLGGEGTGGTRRRGGAGWKGMRGGDEGGGGGVGGGVEDEGGEWDDGEEWMEEWDEDVWESQGEEEDDRDDGDKGFSHQVFGGAGDVARPHARPVTAALIDLPLSLSIAHCCCATARHCQALGALGGHWRRRGCCVEGYLMCGLCAA